jgi:hypothetical protein
MNKNYSLQVKVILDYFSAIKTHKTSTKVPDLVPCCGLNSVLSGS